MGKKFRQTTKKTSFLEQFRELDWFGVPVAMNVEGKDAIKSIPGAIISFILTILFIAYAVG